MNRKANPSRREFLKKTGQAGLVAGLSATVMPALAAFGNGRSPRPSPGQSTPYTQQALPYAYPALEPVIDALTMEIHYTKHAAAYAKNLADAVKAENVDTGKTSLEQLLGSVSKYSAKLKNNAGGHYNHELFWKSMAAPGAHTEPGGPLLAAIQKDFNSLEAFKTQFTDAGKNRFGSGWAWLVLTPAKKLVIGSTANQDNPLMDTSDLKGSPILGLDVWEHAYYLKYQNRRPDYINAWWGVVNWEFIGKRYEGLLA